jgi:6-phosphogluconate dehydrogenase
MIGLGRMGTNMALRLMRVGRSRVVYDIHAESVQALVKDGAVSATSLEDFTQKLWQ